MKTLTRRTFLKSTAFASATLALPPRVWAQTPGNDLRHLILYGNTPTVMVGPGDDPVSHTANESVSVANVVEAAKYYAELRGGNFDVAMDFQCGYIVEPDLDLYKFQSKDKSPANYSRYTDRVLDELYEKQSRAVDAEERRKAIREFERRLVDEEAHYLYTLQWHRIIPHNARVRGWTVSPSHYLNQQLDTVWLAE